MRAVPVTTGTLFAVFVFAASMLLACGSGDDGMDSDAGQNGADAGDAEAAADRSLCKDFCTWNFHCDFLCTMSLEETDRLVGACTGHCLEALDEAKGDPENIRECMACWSDAYCLYDSPLFPDNPNAIQNKCAQCEGSYFGDFHYLYSERVYGTVSGGTFEDGHCPGTSCHFVCATCSGDVSCPDGACGPCSTQCEEACANNGCGGVVSCY